VGRKEKEEGEKEERVIPIISCSEVPGADPNCSSPPRGREELGGKKKEGGKRGKGEKASEKTENTGTFIICWSCDKHGNAIHLLLTIVSLAAGEGEEKKGEKRKKEGGESIYKM